jgi:transcriptional regulator with PAS, ATPase and Fis domain
VGSVKEIPVNVRIIASTNGIPHDAVRQGQLREDLYYRLNVNTILLPPLRERPEDIPLLVDYFLTYFAERLEIFRREIEPAALVTLEQYRWPGNIRELMNVIESAYTFGRSAQITRADLPVTITLTPVTSPRESTPSANGPVSFAEAERDLIARALASTTGNKLSGKLLGISSKNSR